MSCTQLFHHVCSCRVRALLRRRRNTWCVSGLACVVVLVVGCCAVDGGRSAIHQRHHLADCYLVYTVLHNRAVKNDTQAHRQIRFRNYNTFVLSDFMTDVRYELLSFDVNNFTHIDEAWISWKNCFDVISNRHAPIKKSRFKKRSSRWINGNILKLIYKRDYLHKQAILLKSNRLMNEYRQLRNDIHKKIGKLKKDYCKSIEREMQGNPNALWKELAELTACNKLYADDFNDFFCNIGREKTKNLPFNNSILWKGGDSIYQFKFAKIEESSVLQSLKLLSTRSSIDIIDFERKLLRLASAVIARSLTDLYNNYVLDDRHFTK